MMTSKAKAIEALKRIDEKAIKIREIAEDGRFQHFYVAIIIDGIDGLLDLIHREQEKTVDELEHQLRNPTLDDAIKVVEDLFAREIKRFHNRIDSQYSKSWETTTTKIVLAYVVNLQIEFLEALKGLKGE